MPGHSRISDTIFLSKGGQHKKYICPSCHYLLRDAVQPSCGHWLCQTCAEDLFRTNSKETLPKCPKEECEEELTSEDGVNYFADRFVRKEILNYDVVCLHLEKGCTWRGKFAEFENHLDGCEYDRQPCENCGQLLQGQELETHMKVCSEVVKPCPLAEFGCPETRKLKKGDLHMHLESEEHFVNHFELLATTLRSLLKQCKAFDQLPLRPQLIGGNDSFVSDRGDLVETDGVGHGSRMFGKVNLQLVVKEDSEIDGGTPQQRKAFTTMMAMSGAGSDTGLVEVVMQKSNDVLLQELGKLRSEFETSLKGALQKKDEEIAALRGSITKLEKMMRAKNAELEDRDFRLSLIENCNYDGTMIWKIPQFSQRMADAQNGKYTSIFSLPFYTGRYGYKMCLRLYVLGDGIGKNNYLSLFFVIMRGEFDNILPWPFSHKVTFRLINQAGGRDIIDIFQPDPMSSSFKKPKSDMNVASGCPRFVSHHDLKNSGFIVDDTIFVKCMVDPTKIKHP